VEIVDSQHRYARDERVTFGIGYELTDAGAGSDASQRD
jgi:hypothetical protein